MSEFQSRREIETNLIAKAWKDEAFKQQLIDNPKSAIDEAGISLPKNIEVEAIEETSSKFYLVIPQSPTQQEELSDEELLSVAGGGPVNWVKGKIEDKAKEAAKDAFLDAINPY